MGKLKKLMRFYLANASSKLQLTQDQFTSFTRLGVFLALLEERGRQLLFAGRHRTGRWRNYGCGARLSLRLRGSKIGQRGQVHVIFETFD